MDDAQPDRHLIAHRSAQRRQRPGHGRLDGLGRFALHHPETTVAARKKEVDLEPLLIAKVVKLLAPALVDLALQDLGGHVSFEQGPRNGDRSSSACVVIPRR